MSSTPSGKKREAYVLRFTPWQRTQHVAVIVMFFGLVITGLPQKWPYLEASVGAIDLMGGIFAVRWFHRHDVAAVADDPYTFELFPPPVWDNALAVHCINVVDMGLTQGQNWNLEPLSEACAEHGRHEFLLAASPEPFVGGCGAPVNPVAVF